MADTEPLGPGSSREERSKGNSGPVVLVIDDDEVARSLITETLRPLCSRLIELSSPLGATMVARREGIDIVVLDIEMPNLRGDMVATLFRKNPRLSHVGVILVSGSVAEELLSLGRECGADAIISKRQIRTGLAQAVQAAWKISRVRVAARAGAEAYPEQPEPGSGPQRASRQEPKKGE